MKKINLNQIPKEVLDEIFESMAFDETLIEQVNKISNNPKFDDEKKKLYHNYRIGVAFWREAKKRLGDDVPLLKKKCDTLFSVIIDDSDRTGEGNDR